MKFLKSRKNISDMSNKKVNRLYKIYTIFLLILSAYILILGVFSLVSPSKIDVHFENHDNTIAYYEQEITKDKSEQDIILTTLANYANGQDLNDSATMEYIAQQSYKLESLVKDYQKLERSIQVKTNIIKDQEVYKELKLNSGSIEKQFFRILKLLLLPVLIFLLYVLYRYKDIYNEHKYRQYKLTSTNT